MQSIRKQRGMTLVSTIILAALGFFVFHVITTIFPSYSEAGRVGRVLQSVVETPGLAMRDSRAVRTLVMERLEAARVESVEPRDVTVKRVPVGYEIRVSYESSAALFSGFDLIAKFDRVASTPSSARVSRP